MSIHPTAILGKDVKLGEDVSVGAYAIIEDGVSIGSGTVIEPHARLCTGAKIGANCVIASFTVIAGLPQDLHFNKSTVSYVEIGDGTTVRENSTIHRATIADAATKVGKNCLLMASSHIGHDSVLGDNCIQGCFSAIAGFTAHRIKSSSRLVGAVGLAQLLDQIETLGQMGDAAGMARLVPSLVESIASVRQHFRRLESAVQTAPLTHVLCIDDDPVHLNELATRLAQAGAPRVERFTESSELQQRLAELDTSQVLLLLDLHMPCMNGAELIQHLRQWRFNGHVALIGHFDHQMQDTAERLVDGYGLKWAGTLTSPLSEHKVRTILQACGGLRD